MQKVQSYWLVGRSLGVAVLRVNGVAEVDPLLPFRHAVGDAGTLVAGEAEAGEPFAVELPSRLL